MPAWCHSIQDVIKEKSWRKPEEKPNVITRGGKLQHPGKKIAEMIQNNWLGFVFPPCEVFWSDQSYYIYDLRHNNLPSDRDQDRGSGSPKREYGFKMV